MFDLQKASVWKRASAYLLDWILLGILAVGFAFFISYLVGYDGYSERLQEYYSAYETDYGITFSITEEEYGALSTEERQRYDDAYAAIQTDTGVMETFATVMRLSVLMVTFGVLFAYLVLEFLVPLLFGNGQTIGKKVFGLAVIRRDGVRLSPLLLLVRTLLGKYTIETMIPVFIGFLIFFGGLGILGLVVLGGMLLLQIILLVRTENNSAIHDLLAQTVVVDMESQMIFDSEQELLAYKEQAQAERAARQPY